MHQHHAVARSQQRAQFGTVYDWLEINGQLVLVLVDLCGECHDRLESAPGGCKSRLKWGSTGTGWLWYDRATDEEVNDGKARIWWYDTLTKEAWIFKGFCKGTYTLEGKNA